ncbi:MAG: lipid-A-disaccharide synthase [Opitutales bacterium]
MPADPPALPETLPAPPDGQPDLLIVAGEHSGDEHAARIVKDLREAHPSMRISAVGGPQLEAAGAHQVFDLTGQSVIGLVEVLKHYRFFRELFCKVIDWVREHRPRNILFVDYPGFNLRLAEALVGAGLARKGGGEIPLLYYISPQIWAWKAKRRFKMARSIDALGVIFPFEVASYSDTDLDVTFVGHPFVSEDFENKLSYDPEAPILLLPGSRVQPVLRIFPVLLQVYEALLDRRTTQEATVIFPSDAIEHTLETVLARFPKARGRLTLVHNSEKVAGSAVIMSSGTMSLAVALAGIPGSIVYKLHPMTYWLGRVLVNVPYIGIANLLLPDPIHPEFIQFVKRDALVADLIASLEDPRRLKRTRNAAEALRALLETNGDRTAATWLLSKMQR